MVQIGLMLEGQIGLNWDHWIRILKIAEDTGFQSVFRSDHFTNPNPPDMDSLELWTSLTYAASHTNRIEFGPLVTPVTFRNPAMTVRYAAAVDDLSGGRLVLGMGAGWQEREHVNYSIPFYDFPTRFAMFEEALAYTTHVLNSDEPYSAEGKHYTFKDAVLLPRPKRAGGPPILIGGRGPKRTLPLVAKYATEWNTAPMNHDLFAERSALLDGLLEQNSRKPGDVKRSMMTRVLYNRDEDLVTQQLAERDITVEDAIGRGLIVGTGPMIVDQIGKWGELGMDRLMLQWIELDETDRMEAFAQDVLPHVHN